MPELALLPPAIRAIVQAALLYDKTEETKTPPTLVVVGAMIHVTLTSPLPVSLARCAEAAGFTPKRDPARAGWYMLLPIWPYRPEPAVETPVEVAVEATC